MEVIEQGSRLLSARVIQNLMIERVAIDMRTLTRTEYEKRCDQYDRGFDREDRNNVAPEVAQSHDACIDPPITGRAH
jgi:hypothetical protein